jgi:hypothetical protein
MVESMIYDVQVEVSTSMLTHGYIGYDKDGVALFTGSGQGHVQHKDGLVHKVVVGESVWESMKDIAARVRP